jgi:hypothetical protein
MHQEVAKNETKTIHLSESRMRQFAAMSIDFTPAETAHFDECSNCRLRTVELIREVASERELRSAAD